MPDENEALIQKLRDIFEMPAHTPFAAIVEIIRMQHALHKSFARDANERDRSKS